MTALVGILNLTPDSFSDGGAYVTPDAAVAAANAMIADGVSVIDIGAESTRPGAKALSTQEEWQRLSPVLPALVEACKGKAALSLDTYHAGNAARGLALGVNWINDVSGFTSPAMVEAVRDAPCGLVVMHSLRVPADSGAVLPAGADAVEVFTRFAEERVNALLDAGIAQERIILDPGIGFGKTHAQNLALIRAAGPLRSMGIPLLYGHSRKSFFAQFSNAPAQERDTLTVLTSLFLAGWGIDYLRVHNTRLHAEAMRLSGALML